MPNNILITPGSASIQFSGSATNTIRLQVEPSGSIAFYGNSGSLFSITDSLVGSLMSVNDVSGLPILEVFSDDRVVMGTFNKNTLVVTGSLVGVGTPLPSAILHISASSSLPLLKLEDGAVNSDVDIQFVPSQSANTFTLGIDGSDSDKFKLSYSTTLGTNDRIVVDTSGLVGINTTAPGARLHVQGNISASSYTSSILNAVGFLGTSSWAVSSSRAISSQQIDVLSGGATTALGTYSGSFFGTSSWAVTASNAITASFALNTAGGVGFPFSGSAVITGSLLVSGSGITLVGAGLTGSVSGSLTGTASYAQNANLLDGLDSTIFATTGSNTFRGTNIFSGSVTLRSDNILVQIEDTDTTTRYAGLAIGHAGGNWILSAGDNLAVSNNDFWIGRSTDSTNNRVRVARDAYTLSVYSGSNENVVLNAAGSSYFTGGSVGIGTSSPTSILDISQATNDALLRVRSTGAGAYVMASSNDSNYFGFILASGSSTLTTNDRWFIGSYGSPGDLTFTTGRTGTEYMRIVRSTGRVGIGTTSPAALLQISASGATNDLLIGNVTTPKIFVSASGNVVIGATGSAFSPARVSIQDTYTGVSLDNPQLVVGDPTATNGLSIGYRTDSNYAFLYARQVGVGARPLVLQPGGNVGVGTSVPVAKMHISASGTGNDLLIGDTTTPKLFVSGSGNVSIGTTTGTEKLRVVGTFASDAVWTTGASVTNWGSYPTIYGTLTWNTGLARIHASAGNRLDLGANGSNAHITITGSGDVGIGITSSFSNKLHIQGNVSASSYTSSISNAVGFLGTSSWAVSSSRANSSAQVDVLSGGSTTALGSYSGSFTGSFTGNLTGTSSFSTTSSYALNAANTSGFPYTGSAIVSGSIIVTGSMVVSDSITAQTFIIEYVSSSILYDSGSTKFGDSLDDTHQFTGSVSITGSLQSPSITGSVLGTSSWASNAISSSFATSASFAPVGPGTSQSIALFNSSNTVSSSIVFQSGSNIGINTNNPQARLHINGGSLRIDDGSGNHSGFSFSTVTGLTQTNNNLVTLLGGLQVQSTAGNNSYFVGTGNVGIGTTNPTSKLHVTGSTGGIFEVDGVGALNALYVSASGNVGIGTTNPQTSLDIVSVHNTTPLQLKSTGITGTGIVMNVLNGSDNLVFRILGNGSTYIPSGSVGIGTTNPTARLHVTGSTGGIFEVDGVDALNALYVSASGNVGIGITTPERPLHVRGLVYIDRDDVNATQLTIRGSTDTNNRLYIGYDTDDNVGKITAITEGTAFRNLILQGGGGNVGIGTVTPSNKLQVEGNVSASSYTSSINNAVGFLGTSSWAVSSSRALSSAQVDVLSGGATTALGIYSGSLFGTSSWAVTASFALNAGGATAGFPFSGSAVITGSLLISSSGLTLVGSGLTGSVFGTSSWANNAVTASYVLPSGAPAVTITTDTYTFFGNGSTNAYALPKTYDSSSLFVSVGGIVYADTQDYTLSGTTLTFIETPPTQSNIYIRAIVNTTSGAGSFSGSFSGTVNTPEGSFAPFLLAGM